MDADNNIN